MDKDKYICSCCGGRIDPKTMTCEYCGTHYKKDSDNIIRVETFTNPVIRIVEKTVIPGIEVRCIGAEDITRIAMSSIQQKIAAALTDVMKYDVEFKPEINVYEIRGELRAVIPQNDGINEVFGRLQK